MFKALREFLGQWTFLSQVHCDSGQVAHTIFLHLNTTLVIALNAVKELTF